MVSSSLCFAGVLTALQTKLSGETHRLENRSVGKNAVQMDIAVVVIVVLSVVLTAALVIGLFIWAAIKDGREDKAVQARLGIRRKTRLGR
jgi:membrane protein insertase Oxa1/YidC/SpoIIIJ